MRICFGILPAVAAFLLVPPLAAGVPNICSLNPSASSAPYCETCGVSADINQDGLVNGTDLGIVLGSWGPPPAEGPLVDFNNDGAVSCFDQKFVLGNWGPCGEVDANLNGDNVVDLLDVEVLLNAYGTCAHHLPGPSCPEELPLDLDNNRRINQNDVDIVTCFLGQTAPPGYPDVDFNRNGVVDPGDQQIVRDAMGQACPYDLNQNGLVEGTDIRVIIEKG